MTVRVFDNTESPEVIDMEVDEGIRARAYAALFKHKHPPRSLLVRVNGRQADESTRLQDGDRLSISSVRHLVRPSRR